MQLFRFIAPLVVSASLMIASPAFAHTALVSSSPAASATVSNVRSVTLTFNEAFMPQVSGLEIVMTGMPGMEGNHPTMKITGVKVAASADHKSLVATLARPLSAGTYDVNWYAVGADTHRMTGKVSFTVH
jgi:methionine-rich copper-binding protein CopC